MINKEKVIKAWELFRESDPYKICTEYPFQAMRDPDYRMPQMIDDTITLLKEQEAVEPKVYDAYRCQSGRMSRRRAFCGACGLRIRIGSSKQDRSNYCERCGKPVKWNA